MAPDLRGRSPKSRVRRLLGSLAAKNANARETAFLLGPGSTTTRLGDRRPDALSRGVAHLLQRPTARGLAGNAPVGLRVPDAMCLLTRLVRRQRLPLRGGLRSRRSAPMSPASRAPARAVLSAGIHPEYRETVRTYFRQPRIHVGRGASPRRARPIPRRSPPPWTATRSRSRCSRPTLRSRRGLGDRLPAPRTRRARSRRGRGEAISLALLARPRAGRRHRCGEAPVARRSHALRRPGARVPRVPVAAPSDRSPGRLVGRRATPKAPVRSA